MNISQKPLIKLVRQDIELFLCLIGNYRPAVDPYSLLSDFRRLSRCEAWDYLFLVSGGQSRLFPALEAYIPDSEAFLAWTDLTLPQADAFYLRLSGEHPAPQGTVVLLDHRQAAADAVQAARLAPRERSAHLWRLMKHWREHARMCSIAEMVSAMGGET